MPDLPPETVDHLRKIAKAYAVGKKWKLTGDPRVGGSAAVFPISNKSETLALKVYAPSFFEGPDAAAQMKRVELQRRLISIQCESLIKLYSIDLFSDTCVSLMEYLPWPELKSVLKQIPSDNIQSIVDSLVSAVRALSEKGIIHRDIKPENILISPDFSKIKLVDMGVIREISDNEDRLDATDQGSHKPFLATAQYSSPEYLFRTKEPGADLWNSLNIYQIGAVIHDLITQSQLFSDEIDAANRYRLALAVLTKKPLITTKQRARNPRLAAISERCLAKDADLRLVLVGLDDFQSPSNLNAIDRLKGELKKIAESGDFEAKLELLLRKNQKIIADCLEEITTTVFDRINAAFGSMLTLSRPAGSQVSKVHPIRIGIPNTRVSYDFVIEAQASGNQLSDEIQVTLSDGKGDSTSRTPQGTIRGGEKGEQESIVEKITESIASIIVRSLEEIEAVK